MADNEQPWPKPAYAWYVVGLLTVAYVVSFLDRQIISLLLPQIQADLGATDEEMGRLGGFAFALFYTVLGIPIGLIADRKSRTGLIAIGVTLWCAMTAACGLAGTYIQLFLARMGVGVGEATLNPSALSLIADYFRPEKRSLPLGLYNMGVSLGTGVSFILGGAILGMVGTTPSEVPVLGEVKAWQAVFLIVGLPGLLVALLMRTVREPLRRGKIKIGDAVDLPFSYVFTFLKARLPLFATFTLGMSIVAYIGYMYFLWVPAYFERTFDIAAAETGKSYGLLNLVIGLVTVIATSIWASRRAQGGDKEGPAKIALLCAAICVPAAALMPQMPTPELAYVMLAIMSVGAAGATAAGPMALIAIVPNQLRAQVTAVYYFVLNVMGAVGPWAAGALSTSSGSLGSAITMASGIGGGLLLILFVLNRRYYHQGIAEAEAWTS